MRSGTYGTVYNVAQFDPCQSEFTSLIIGSGVYQLLQSRIGGDLRTDKGDYLTKEIVGCTTQKLRLMPHAIYVKTVEEGVRLISHSPDVSQKVVIRSGKEFSESLQVESNELGGGDIHVTKFSANQIELTADVKSNPGTWLVYADGYHPDWHAFVNGQETPIEEAYVSFKAVWLPYGNNVVRFEYYNKYIFPLYYFLAICGAIFCAFLLIWLLWPFDLTALAIQVKRLPLKAYQSFSNRTK